MKPRSHEAGGALLAVIIALGVSAVVMSALAQSLGDNFRAVKKLELSTEKQQIARAVTGRIDCARTLAALKTVTTVGACAEKGYLVEIVDRLSQTVVSRSSDSASLIGKHVVRARCSKESSSPGIILQAARPNLPLASGILTRVDPDAFRVDPLTKQSEGWIDAGGKAQNELVPKGGYLCASEFAAELAGKPTTFACPAGSIMTGFTDSTMKTVRCTPMVTVVQDASARKDLDAQTTKNFTKNYDARFPTDWVKTAKAKSRKIVRCRYGIESKGIPYQDTVTTLDLCDPSTSGAKLIDSGGIGRALQLD